MEEIQENTTPNQNQSDFWDGTDGLFQTHDRAFTRISLCLGSCITIINVTTLYLLLRHRRCIEGTGFWQQLIFLCSTDTLSGIAIALPPFGFLFYDIHVDIYYSFCVCGLIFLPLSMTLSTGTCCVISINRYVLLRYIDQPTTIWYKYTSFMMLLGNGLLCILTASSSSVLVVSILYGFQYKEFCYNVDLAGQTTRYKSKYLMGTLIMMTLYLIGSNIFSVLSILKIRTMNRIQSGTDTSAQSLNTIKRNRYATITFVQVVIALDLASIPTLLFMFASRNNGLNVSADTTEILSRLISMNSLLNPFIYSMRSTKFRIAIWKDMKAVLSRIRCSCDVT